MTGFGDENIADRIGGDAAVVRFRTALSAPAHYVWVMAILKKLKSLFGLNSSETAAESSRDVGVTVERGHSEDESAAAGGSASASTDSMSRVPSSPKEGAEPGEAAGPTTSQPSDLDAGADDSSPAATGTVEDSPADDVDSAEEPEEPIDVSDVLTEAEPETSDEGDDSAEDEEADSPEEPTDVEGTDAEETAEARDESDLEAPTEDDEEADADDASVEDGEAEPDEEAAAETDAGEPVDVIKGIGPAYAERLGDAGIETVSDLAGADPVAVTEDADVSESRLEDWIGKAKNR